VPERALIGGIHAAAKDSSSAATREGNEEDDTVVRAFIARASGWGHVVLTLTYSPVDDVTTARVRWQHMWARDEALSGVPGPLDINLKFSFPV
jgi:hypothetical protein